MPLTERHVIDRITILEDGTMEIREAIIVLRDGLEIARSFHRRPVTPDDNVAGEHPRIRALALALRANGPDIPVSPPVP